MVCSAQAIYPVIQQCDPRWAAHSLGGPRCLETMCSTGCFVAALFSVLRHHGLANHVTASPVTLNQWMQEKGHFAWNSCALLYSATHPLGLTLWHPTNNPAPSRSACWPFDRQCAWLQDPKHSLLGHINGGRHWVVLMACRRRARRFLVMDPLRPRRLFVRANQVREVLLYSAENVENMCYPVEFND